MHVGHCILAMFSDVATTFLSRKIALIARGGCPPDRWGHGLQVMLEKVAGVALVNKLRAILLMEGDFNYMNKGLWTQGNQQTVYSWLYPRQPVQPKGEHSRGRPDGQSAYNGHFMPPEAATSHNGSRRGQMLRQNQPYHYVVLPTGHGGNDWAYRHNATPNSGNEVLSAYSKRGLYDIHGRTRQRQSTTRAMPREWGSPSLLADDKLTPDALLQIPRIRLPVHIPHQQHHHRLPRGNLRQRHQLDCHWPQPDHSRRSPQRTRKISKGMSRWPKRHRGHPESR